VGCIGLQATSSRLWVGSHHTGNIWFGKNGVWRAIFSDVRAESLYCSKWEWAGLLHPLGG
jgi:hypothetical protein